MSEFSSFANYGENESCLLKGKGTDGKGKPMDFTEQFTDTWVKMPKGQWQCVASHGTNIKK